MLLVADRNSATQTPEQMTPYALQRKSKRLHPNAANIIKSGLVAFFDRLVSRKFGTLQTDSFTQSSSYKNAIQLEQR
jgi:hypothetical protein